MNETETPAERRLRELISYDYGDDDGTLSRAADMGREALALWRVWLTHYHSLNHADQRTAGEAIDKARALLARAGEE